MTTFNFNTLKKISLILGMSANAALLNAQDGCKDALYEANKLFEAGNIKECIDRLEPCLGSKKSKEERVETYHLLAQAHQNLNNPESAQKYIIKMLKKKPDYQRFPNIDPLDFSRLVNQYAVSPKIFVGLKAGINRNSVALKKSYAVYKSDQSYNPLTGFQVGATVDYRLMKDLSLSLDILYSGIGINHVVNNAGGWKQDYNEQQNYLIPNLILSKYVTLRKDLSLYGGVGFNASYLMSTNVFFEITNLETGSVQQATQNPLDYRNKWQTAANAHLGLAFPFYQGLFGIESNYFYYFGRTVNSEKRMDDLNFIFNNQYVNDDISLRLLSFNISYKLPLVYKIGLKG